MVVDYGNVRPWLDKCLREAQRGRTVVALIPARTNTVWFHDIVLEQCKEVRFVKGKVVFTDGPNHFGDALAVFHHVPNKRTRAPGVEAAVLTMQSDFSADTVQAVFTGPPSPRP